MVSDAEANSEASTNPDVKAEMNPEKIIARVSFVLALVGLALVYFFSPEITYQRLTVEQVSESCEGYVSVSGEIVKTFYSQKGNFIVTVSDGNAVALVVTDPIYKTGDIISLKGRASEYGSSCWIFPEDIEKL
ncbi:MAG: OB-fold nucleic acid binding domain-containing protein [Candidatus Micrarchaeota archaeon]